MQEPEVIWTRSHVAGFGWVYTRQTDKRWISEHHVGADKWPTMTEAEKQALLDESDAKGRAFREHRKNRPY